jgi:HPt (histidine-containing phosphotransfer) domain-containing protein
MDGYVSKPLRDEDLQTEIAHAVVLSSALGLEFEPSASDADTATEDPSRTLDGEAIIQRIGGNSETLRELLEVFETDSAALAMDLQTALEERQADKLRIAAHTLKSMFGFFDAKTAYEACRQLEQAAEVSDFRQSARLLVVVQEELTYLRSELKRFNLAGKS